MEKIILVYYIAVGNLSGRDVDEYLEKISEKFTPKEGDVSIYIIPIGGTDSRIECLNPKLVSEEDYKQAKELLDRNQKIVDEIVESYKVDAAIKEKIFPAITNEIDNEILKSLKTGKKSKCLIPFKTLPKYLVRPSDYCVFEIDESSNCYRSFSSTATYSDGTKPQAQYNFTFENLTKNYDFFTIEESELEFYEKKHDVYMDYLCWSCRSDGHGGTKGGTMEEYLEKFGE